MLQTQETSKQLRAYLARAESSVVSYEPEESDQSILDDHCSRVFSDDTPPHR